MSELSEARAQAAAARADFFLTAERLQQRLKPAALAEVAMDGARKKSGEIAEDAVNTVRQHPVKVGAAVAGVSAFLGFNLFRRFLKPSTKHGD